MRRGPATETRWRGVEDEDGGIGRQRGDDVGEGADPDREMEMGSGEVRGLWGEWRVRVCGVDRGGM